MIFKHGDLINNHFQTQKAEKQHQDNIVLISYRLEELEKEVDKHNNLIERTYEVEKKVGVLEEKQKVANNRIADLEKGA